MWGAVRTEDAGLESILVRLRRADAGGSCGESLSSPRTPPTSCRKCNSWNWSEAINAGIDRFAPERRSGHESEIGERRTLTTAKGNPSRPVEERWKMRAPPIVP